MVSDWDMKKLSRKLWNHAIVNNFIDLKYILLTKGDGENDFFFIQSQWYMDSSLVFIEEEYNKEENNNSKKKEE